MDKLELELLYKECMDDHDKTPSLGVEIILSKMAFYQEVNGYDQDVDRMAQKIYETYYH